MWIPLPVLIFALIFNCFFGIAQSHICLLTPHQRGNLNISTGGNPTCFRHGAPCGGQSAEEPKVMWMAGTTEFVKWQQNYNHYEIGYPGYMDLAIAQSENSTEEEYTTLAVVQDPYEYAQDHQQNYTAVVAVPLMDCQHCILRARYNAHKPGETTFYQCADVTVVSPKQEDKRLLFSNNLPPVEDDYSTIHRAVKFIQDSNEKRLNQFVDNGDLFYGFAYNPFQSNKAHYVAVNTTTGALNVLKVFNFGLGLGQRNNKESVSQEGQFLLDSIVAVDNGMGTTNFLLHNGALDDQTETLFTLNTKDGTTADNVNISPAVGAPINGITWYGKGRYITFSILPAEKAGTYYFSVGLLYNNGSYTQLVKTDTPEDLYINYQYMEKDGSSDRLYVLMGNENSPDQLLARLYIFDVVQGTFENYVNLNVSNYTFSSFRSWLMGDTSMLYAVSPGLFGEKYPSWSLVSINTGNGQVYHRCDIASPGVFQSYYGGAVFHGMEAPGSKMFYVFRVADAEADVIASIELKGDCTVTFSPLTNLRHLHNLAYLQTGM